MQNSRLSRLLAALALAISGATAAAEAPLATALVEQRELAREFQLDGLVEAVQQTTVSAQTSGQVEKVLFDVDDYVEKGQVIVELAAAEHRARVDRAAADLDDARARLQEARDEHQRARELFSKQLVSESAMDKAEAALKSARARAQAAEAGLAEARQQLDYTQVRAPYSGIVTERHVEVGSMAQPGQALMSGISLERLRVRVDVPQSLIVPVRASGEARVRLPDGTWVNAGEQMVFPFADQGSNSFRVRLELPEGAPELFPGMWVKTAFRVGSQERLVVPAKALVYRSEVTAVYVVDEQGKVGFRRIRAGSRLDDGLVEVLAGLEAGERVALEPVSAGVLLKRQREGRVDE